MRTIPKHTTRAVAAFTATGIIAGLGAQAGHHTEPVRSMSTRTDYQHRTETFTLKPDHDQSTLVTKKVHHRRPDARPASRSLPRRTPRVVPGLTLAQTRHAKAIMNQGDRMGVDRRGQVVALSTALQESGLRVYANASVPASFDQPHEAVGYDHASVGLFQQQTPMWGSVHRCMNPHSSAKMFYQRLLTFQYHGMPVTVAAQTVQGSAFPGAYADDHVTAVHIYNTLKD